MQSDPPSPTSPSSGQQPPECERSWCTTSAHNKAPRICLMPSHVKHSLQVSDTELRIVACAVLHRGYLTVCSEGARGNSSCFVYMLCIPQPQSCLPDLLPLESRAGVLRSCHTFATRMTCFIEALFPLCAPSPAQKDIIDTPPNPSQPITESRLTPIPKPWDRRQAWEAPALPSADPSAAVSENAAAAGAHLLTPPPTQNGGGSRSITGPGSTSRSRFAADRPFDNLNSSPTPGDFYSHSSNHMNGVPSSNPQTYLESGSQEQQLLQSFTQDGTSANGGASVPAATAAAAATAVAAAAEQPAPQHHRISILPAPGTGPVWRPPPVPAPTMPSRQPQLPTADAQLQEQAPPAPSSSLHPAAHDHLNTTSQPSQEQAQATPSVPLGSFPLEPNMGTTPVKPEPSSPTSGSTGPRGAGASTLNSNAKPFLASSAAALAAAAPAPAVPAPVQKSPKRRTRGAVNGSAAADATVSPTSGVSQEGGWSVVSPPVPQEVEAEVAGGSAGPSSPEVQSHP